MKDVMDRIFEVLENLGTDTVSSEKAFLLGQIAGNISKGENIWCVRTSCGELLEEVLEEIQVTYITLECVDGNFYVEVA